MAVEQSIPCLVCGRCLRISDCCLCENCNAVCYCSSGCKEHNFFAEVNPEHGHLLWCSKMRAFMSIESRLREIPLAFGQVTTSECFSDNQMTQFLTAHGILNMGLWKYEHPLGARDNLLNSVSPPGSELVYFSALWTVSKFGAPQHDPSCGVWSKSTSTEDAMLRAYCLPIESILLSVYPSNSTAVDKQQEHSLVVVSLTNWAEYYLWRGFANESHTQHWRNFSSPIAILMHWPLTIYYILAHILPRSSPQLIVSVIEKGLLIIHVVGVEHELSMLPVFLELVHLIKPELVVRLHFIGPCMDPTLDSQVFHLTSRLSIAVSVGTYHEVIRNRLQQLDFPDVIIGFNSGLSAYSSWTSTLKVIHALSVPAYFTDACLYSCAWGYRVAAHLGIGTDEYRPEQDVLDDVEGTGIRAPILNPFRSPIRMQSAGVRWGWFKNAFIYAPIQPTLPSAVIQGDSDLSSKLTSLQLE